jgi:isopentenyl phosphate kinase
VDGVYTDDPLENPDAVRIPRITPGTFDDFKAHLGGSHGIDVTGGMLGKVREMVELVAQGYTERVHLVSGRHKGALMRVLLGTAPGEGTVIEPDRV